MRKKIKKIVKKSLQIKMIVVKYHLYQNWGLGVASTLTFLSVFGNIIF